MNRNNELLEETNVYKISRPIQTSLAQRQKQNQIDSKNKKTLFNHNLIEQAATSFDITKPTIASQSALLRVQNPRLLALRSRKDKQPTKRSYSTRPVTAAPDPSQQMKSLLTKRPLSPIKIPEINGVELLQKKIEDEKNTLLFTEDPVAYFSKRKDGRGHRFIYLNFAGNRKDPFFSPYELVKVPYSEVHSDYFTMSANGVTHILPDGNTDNITLDQWSKETSIFKAIRKLRTFNQFYYWKSFRVWKNFVMQQRFDQILDKVYEFSYYNNPGFYATTIAFLRTTTDTFLKKFLLSFNPQKKYLLQEFLDLTKSNRKSLKEEYSIFFNDSIDLLINLDKDIRDPRRRVVSDSDFPEIKRQNPNLGQLIVLERKKQAEKFRRHEVVQYEIQEFANFIRLTDYILLEALVGSCLECWKIAESNITQPMASIFTIEISFSEDGQIVFTPTFETLMEKVNKALNDSISLLEKLPRIVLAGQLRAHLRETLGVELSELFEHGPSFKQFVDTEHQFAEIHKHIIDVFNQSYDELEKAAQTYLIFFPIYKIKLSWNPHDYIHERGGTPDPIDITQTSVLGEQTNDEGIIFDSSKEKIINFNQVRKDIDTFEIYEEMLSTFRSAGDHAALFIDARQLRAILTPIPMDSLKRLEQILLSLTNEKIDKLSNIFKYCQKRMKKEPNTLERFVDFSDFLSRAIKLTQYLSIEIKFIDDMFALFETVNFSDEVHSKNPLHDVFSSYKNDIQAATELRDLNSDKFSFILQQEIKRIQRKINKYHEIFTSFPESIESTSIESMLSDARAKQKKFDYMESKIKDLKYYQEVMHISINDFKIFDDVISEADFMNNLFETISHWHRVSNSISKAPFMSIDMPTFIQEITSLHDSVEKMKTNPHKDNILLDQIDEKINESYPYLEELDKLFNGRMQPHHWNNLFQICGKQNAYYPHIKIEELMKYGILKEKEKIHDITTQSQGEAQLEAEFQSITTHWNNVEIPLIETHDEMTADTMTLGNLNHLFKQINETQANLQNMLEMPFVKNIKNSIIQISIKIQDSAEILEEWERFQTNWKLLSPIFYQDDTKHHLSKENTKFQMVKKRWSQLVKHTLADRRLFQVCSFPTLLSLLNDNNNTIDSIINSLDKYFEIKRKAFPRLYFISNMELLKMISTNDFTTMSHLVTKLFMNIRGLDFQNAEKSDILHETKPKVTKFSKIKVSGFIGKDGDTFCFNNYIICNGMMENWLNEIFKIMKSSMKESLSSSIARIASSSLSDWIITVPSYIAILTLHISFARDIDECFTNFENNARAFSNYEMQLTEKFKNLKVALANPNDHFELLKISNILTLLNYHISSIQKLSGTYQHYSQKENWDHHLRVLHDVKTNSVKIVFNGMSIESGYEFYGSTKQMIITPAAEQSLLHILTHMKSNKIPYIYGNRGKKHLLTTLASIFGQFLYIVPSFISNDCLYSRFFTATASCGSWICFEGLEKQNQETVAYLYDTLRAIDDVRTNTFNFPPSSRIFFIGPSSVYKKESQLLPQLKSLLKPVAFAAPDLRLIAITKLNVLGFKTVKTIGNKIFTTVNTIVHTFDSLLTQSALIIIFQIVDNAHLLLEDVIHSSKINFVDYYNDTQAAEEYSVARSFYQQFRYLVRPNEIEILLKIIYSSFRLFDSFETFVQNVTIPNCLEVEEAEGLIRNAMKEIIDKEKYPAEYITEQVISLYNLMLTRSVIFIAGPPNSGKSTVISYIKKCFLNLSRNADIINRFPSIRPIKFMDVYHETLPEDQMFNRHDHYGKLYSIVYNLMQFEKTHHCILRFNGPLTTSFANRISEMSREFEFCFETFDSFLFSQKFHIFVETENFSEFSPSLLSIAGILPMRNIESFSHKTFESHSTVLFNRALYEVNPTFSVEIIKNEFIEKVPRILSLIDRLLPDFDQVYLHDVLLSNSIKFALTFINARNVLNEVEAIRKVLALSIYHSYSSLFKNSLNEFNDELLSLFECKVPEDWTGFDAPKDFIELYPKPTLNTTFVFKNELIPLQISKLKENPITPKTEIITHHDISLFSSNLLPALFVSGLLFQAHSNIFIQGPPQSGKTSFIKLLFHENPQLEPIYIDVSHSITSDSLLNFLNTHTITTVKEYIMMSRSQRFVFVFEDLSPHNLRVIELIRMIIQSRKFPETIEQDPKFLNFARLSMFSILVTSSHSITEFSLRFTSHFFPIKLSPLPIETIHHIFHAKANYLKVPGSSSEKAFDIFKENPSYDIFKYLDILPKVNSENETTGCIKFDHNIFSHNKFIETDTIFFPEILLDFQSVKASENKIHDLRQSYQISLNEFQQEFKLPLSIKLYSPVICNLCCLQRLLFVKNGSCFLVGQDGSGRYSLARFISYIKKIDFYHLNENTFYTQFESIISKCVLKQQHCIVFIRENIRNHRIIKKILTFIKNPEFLEFLTNQDAFYLEYLKDNVKDKKLNSQLRIHAHREIKEILKTNLHFIIAINNNYKLYKYKFMLTLNCELSESQLINCAQERFEQNEVIPTTFTSLVVKIHSRYGKYQNQFYDFIETFLEFLKSEEENSKQLELNKKKTIEFFDKIRNKKSEIANQLNEIIPKLDDSTTVNDELKEKYEEKKSKIENMLLDLNKQEHYILDKNSDLKIKINEQNEILADQLTEVDKQREAMSKLTKEDLVCLTVLAENPPPNLRTLIRILCAYIQIDLEYESSGKPLLLSPDFLNRIKTLINHLNVDDAVLEITNPIFEKAKFTKKDFESVAPPAVSIFLWIQAVNFYANTQMNINHAKAAIKSNLAELEKIKKDNQPKRDEVKKLQEELKIEEEKINSKESDLEVIQQQKEKCTEYLDKIEKILENIEDFENDCKIIQKPKEICSTMFLIAFYLVYCGPFSLEKREQMLSNVFAELNLNTSNCISFMALKLAELCPVNNLDKSFSSSIELEGQHILLSLRPVLICDNNGIIFTYLKSQIEKIQSISFNQQSFFETVITAMINGQKIVINDVFELNENMEFILRLLISHTRQFVFNKKTIDIHPNFKLLMFTKSNTLNDDLLSRVCFIDTSSSSLVATKKMIKKSFVSKYSPSIIEKLDLSQRTEFEQLLFKINSQKILISLLSQYLDDDDVLNNKEKITKILKSKENIIKSSKPIQLDIETKYEIAEAISGYNDAINGCCNLWETFSRHFDTNKLFKFRNFMAIIESFYSNQNELLQNVLKRLMQYLPVQDAYCLIFLSTIKEREDYLEIIQEILSKKEMKIEKKSKSEQEDIFEIIKNDSNILDIYDLMVKTMKDVYQDITYPIFPIETFSQSNIMIIYSQKYADPTPLLEQFMIMRNRNDSFLLFTLTKELKNASQIISILSHGYWIALIYSDPSPEIGGFLADVIAHSTQSTKIVIICHTIEFFPDSVISKASFYNFDNFPSIRIQMIQIYQHYQTSIRSSADPTMIKKLTYVTSLVFSLLNFRDFVKPLGFTEFSGIPENIMKDLIDLLRTIVDSGKGNLHIRNLRDHLLNVVFGGNCIDTFDRRKLRLHLYQVFNNFEKVVQFVDPPSNEESLWAVPPDAPIGNYIHIFEKYPFISSADILLMDRKISSYFEKLDLGRFFIKPFFNVIEQIGFDDDIELNLPELIEIDSLKFDSAEGLIILHEIKQFNSLIKEMRNCELTKTIKEEWKEKVKYIESDDIYSFVRYLEDKRNYLISLPSNEIDVRLTNDLRGILFAHLQDQVVKLNVPIDSVEYTFSNEPDDNSIVLKNLISVGMTIDTRNELNALTLRKESSPFTVLEPIYAKISLRSQQPGQKMFMMPIFRTIPSPEYSLKSDLKRTDGDTDNFIWYMPIQASASDKYFVANGSCIICQIPNLFI